MIVQGVLAMPVLAAGGSPVLAYNLVLMAGFALTGWAFCLLIRHWTGSWAAGYIGGSLAAFNSHVLVRLAHMQTPHVEFVALMLFALDGLIVRQRTRDALLLGAGFALQGLTSQMVLLMIAVLAGFGAADLCRRARSARTSAAVAAGVTLCALVNIEARRAPLVFTPFSEIPAIYDVLARERSAVIVELPLYEPRAFFGNARYMLSSTRHWRPRLNGYSGFRPASYFEHYDAVHGFPDAATLSALHALGVTHVVVHEAEFGAQVGRDRFDQIARIGSLQPIA
jgi:hypothetical protein